ncbi:MAG: hypothetical protein KDA75_04110, partial [Planctomycetaceae bacterium]|nr:hypothetical protein [Planctomycetaceae bacterium]
DATGIRQTPPVSSNSASATTPLQQRGPATAEPTGVSPAPTIPDPNAAVSPTGQLAARSSTETPAPYRPQAAASVEHQRVAATNSAGDDALPWRQVAVSSGGRPIEMLQLGRGPRHLILTASLVGNELDSVRFVESLARLLQREPQRLGDYTLVAIRTPNPDGLVDGTLTNSHGVSLNRNFPSENFFSQRTAETGLTALSEPETQALVQLCDDFRPDRVLHIRSGQGSRLLVLANANSVNLLRQRIDRSMMDGGEYDSLKAGSLEEYATAQLNSELFVVSLPGDASTWEDRLPQLASILIGPPGASIRPASQSPEETPTTLTPTASVETRPDTAASNKFGDLFAPYEPPGRIAGQPASDIAPVPGKKGFVEILPPPPEFSEIYGGRDAKYFELSPPPG